MAFDLSRLRRGEQIAAGSGVLLFILLFFDWYKVSVDIGDIGSFGGGASAWQSFGFIDIVLFVVVLAALGLAFLTATQRTPALPVTASVIVAALGALGTLLVLYRLLDPPGGDLPDAVDVSRTVWAFLGLLAVAGVTYGGYLAMREEGTSLSDVGEQARAAFDSAASPPPPPPPAPAATEAPPAPVAAPPSEPADEPPSSSPPGYS